MLKMSGTLYATRACVPLNARGARTRVARSVPILGKCTQSERTFCLGMTHAICGGLGILPYHATQQLQALCRMVVYARNGPSE